MRLTHLLDTNICVALLRGEAERARLRINATRPGTLALSAVTVAELAYGAELAARPGFQRERVEKLAAGFALLPFSPEVAWEYGRLRAELRKAGTPIGSLDTLIAAHARHEKLILVTDNLREFTMVAGLQVENWLRR